MEYGIKIETDIDNGTSKIFIDGILRADNIKLLSNKRRIDTVKYSTPTQGEGSLLAGPIIMYKGYTVNERCISTLTGFLSDQWRITGNTAGASIKKTGGTDTLDEYSINILDESKNERVAIRRDFSILKENTAFEFNFFAYAEREGLMYELLSGSDVVLTLLADKGRIAVRNKEGVVKTVTRYKTNLWNNIKIAYNYDNNTITLQMNHKERLRDFTLGSKKSSITGIRFSTIRNNQSNIYIDDIVVKKILPLPDDYVPTRVVNSNGDYIVGMQFFPLYREGYHLGWDMINGYHDRTPLLGFYDEGNPDTNSL